MQPWLKHVGSVMVLTIGLIACFVPSPDEVVDIAATRLPLDTPLLIACSEPEPLLDALEEVLGWENAEPERWQAAGIDIGAGATLAYLPGTSGFWMMSFALSDDTLAEEGLGELLNPWTSAHRVVLDGRRAFALVSVEAPAKEAWRDAARNMESPRFEKSLAQAEHLEPLDESGVMVYINPDALTELIDAPKALSWLTDSLEPCTFRGRVEREGWQGSLSCASAESHPLFALVDEAQNLAPSPGEDLEAALSLHLRPEALSGVWEQLAERDEVLDEAHTWWLDVASDAEISPRSFFAEALNGEVALSMSHWPGAASPAGLMFRLGLSERSAMAHLLDAIIARFEGDPGVRLEAESYRGIEGHRVEWLRHRGHDLSWALGDDALYIAYGRADLEDVLKEVDEPQWEEALGFGSAWLNLASTMELEGLVEGARLDLEVDQGALGLRWRLSRSGERTEHEVMQGIIAYAERAWEAHQIASLRRTLSSLCDAIDLYAIEHALPRELSTLSLGIEAIDPWGRPMLYSVPATRQRHHRYDLCSLGPDGQPGTHDDLCYE